MSTLKNSWWKYTVLLIYLILLSIAVMHHEPWFDESQAWLLARDAGLFDLLVKYMRYEGSPALWHLLLMIPAKLQLPYISLNIISAAAAAGSVYLFLRYSPFPWFIKVLFPFSFFIFFQYAVIARSYALIPLLLFLIAVVYSDRMNKPYLYILLLCLLANVSLHGLLIAGGLTAVHIYYLHKLWGQLDSSVRNRHIIGLKTFGFIVFLLVLQLKPPADLISLAAFKADMTHFVSRSLFMMSDSLGTNLALPPKERGFLFTLSYIFSRLVIFLSFFWFYLKKKLLTFSLPLLGLLLLFTTVYANVWHQGTLFFLWLFVLWLSLKERDISTRLEGITRKAVIASLTVILIIQASWSFSSFRYDYSNAYSGSRELAEYIKENTLDKKRIYITGFHTISILPYFKENIFCNFNNGQKPAFWLWSSKNSMYTEPFALYKRYNADIIIWGIKDYYKKNSSHNKKLPDIPGYKLVRLFDGGLYWKDMLYESDSFALYEKVKE